VSADDRIFLWDAGPDSGTAGSPEAAFERAAPYLGGPADVTVNEAVVEMRAVGGAGAVPEYRRTGKTWRGRLKCGAPSWERVAAGEPAAGQ